MPSLGNLFVRLTADTSGLDRAERRSTAAFNSIGRAARRATLALATSTTAAIVGVTGLTQASLRNLDAMSKQSRVMGTTTRNIQELNRAADLAGVTQGEINSSMRAFARTLGEAAEGLGPAKDALDRMNLSATELYELPLTERIATINEAMREFIPEAERGAIAADLFGRSGLAMTLIDTETIRVATEDIRRFGVAVSDVDAQAIEETNDALSRMRLVFESIGNRLAARVAPTLKLIADRFADMSEKGGALDQGIERLVNAFDSLVTAIAKPEVIDAAVKGFEALMVLAEGGARAMVFFAENTEIAMGAITALGLAMLGLSGPFGILALGAGAAVALYKALSNSEKPATDFGTAISEADAALTLLNSSLDGFRTSSPTTQQAALNNASAYKVQAQAALAAAEAALQEQRARQSAANALLDQNPLTAGGNSGYAEAMDEDTRKLEEALTRRENALSEANNRIRNLVIGITGADVPAAPTGPVATPPEIVPITEDGEGGDTGASGLGNAEDIQHEFEERLQVLQAGMDTEREAINAWREQALEDLTTAKDQGYLTEEEYRNRVESLELEHQARMSDMRHRASQEELRMRKQTINATVGLLQQLGAKNKAFAKAAVVINAAQRVSEITANTAAAATRALAELGPIAGPPAAARIAAFGAVQKGIAIASAAMNLSGGGGSAGGGGSVVAESGGGGQSVAPSQSRTLTLIGNNFNQEQFTQGLEFINEGIENGAIIKGDR